MKTTKLCALLLAGILAQVLAAQAADLFVANVRGTCKQVGDNDRIISARFNNATILRDYAALQDPPLEPRDLKLAYDPEGDRIVIVNSSGEILTDIFDFALGTSAANTDDSQRVRQVFLFPGDSGTAIGTAILTERFVRDGETNITRMSSRGTLQFSKAGSDTEVPQVCTGTFTAARKLAIKVTEPPETNTTNEVTVTIP